MQTSRTTVDLEEKLARKLKEYAARHDTTQREIISKAVRQFLGREAIEKDATKLWERLRRLSRSGNTNLNLIEELRKDRGR